MCSRNTTARADNTQIIAVCKYLVKKISPANWGWGTCAVAAACGGVIGARERLFPAREHCYF
jgi:hypothetical protein